jgi:hypothetical protein
VRHFRNEIDFERVSPPDRGLVGQSETQKSCPSKSTSVCAFRALAHRGRWRSFFGHRVPRVSGRFQRDPHHPGRADRTPVGPPAGVWTTHGSPTAFHDRFAAAWQARAESRETIAWVERSKKYLPSPSRARRPNVGSNPAQDSQSRRRRGLISPVHPPRARKSLVATSFFRTSERLRGNTWYANMRGSSDADPHPPAAGGVIV